MTRPGASVTRRAITELALLIAFRVGWRFVNRRSVQRKESAFYDEITAASDRRVDVSESVFGIRTKSTPHNVFNCLSLTRSDVRVRH